VLAPIAKMVIINGQMKSIAISQFKTHCLSLLDDVARTGQPLLVVKRGKPLARVLPSSSAGTDHPQSTLRGTVTYLGDVIEPTVPVVAWASRLPKTKKRH
jgi:prevent-host-death family protein